MLGLSVLLRTKYHDQGRGSSHTVPTWAQSNVFKPLDPAVLGYSRSGALGCLDLKPQCVQRGYAMFKKIYSSLKCTPDIICLHLYCRFAVRSWVWLYLHNLFLSLVDVRFFQERPRRPEDSTGHHVSDVRRRDRLQAGNPPAHLYPQPVSRDHCLPGEPPATDCHVTIPRHAATVSWIRITRLPCLTRNKVYARGVRR